MIRKQLAGQLAEAVEQLILALVGFPKVLVAAVNGTITGLGETSFSDILFFIVLPGFQLCSSLEHCETHCSLFSFISLS